MLHQSFIHLAYCCALLLCSLQDQFQIATNNVGEGQVGRSLTVEAVTIIIDGATTNEWATRDEYQRLMEQAALNGPPLSGGGGGAGAQQLQLQREQQDDLSLTGSAQAPKSDRVELIRQALAVSGSATPLAAPDDEDLLMQQQQSQQQSQLNSDDPMELLDALEALTGTAAGGSKASHKRRFALAPRKYCGKMLIDALETVCDARFYDGKEPEISQPIIKSRRFATENRSGRQQLASPAIKGRRKLRTLDNFQQQQQQQQQQLDRERAAAAAAASSNWREQFYDGSSEIKNTNHNQQYLSPSSSLAAAKQQQKSHSYKGTNMNNNNNNNNDLVDDNLDLNSSEGGGGDGGDGGYGRQQQQQSSSSMMISSRKDLLRRRRGAHTECCLQPCDADQLKAFCASPR